MQLYGISFPGVSIFSELSSVLSVKLIMTIHEHCMNINNIGNAISTNQRKHINSTLVAMVKRTQRTYIMGHVVSIILQYPFSIMTGRDSTIYMTILFPMSIHQISVVVFCLTSRPCQGTTKFIVQSNPGFINITPNIKQINWINFIYTGNVTYTDAIAIYITSFIALCILMSLSDILMSITVVYWCQLQLYLYWCHIQLYIYLCHLQLYVYFYHSIIHWCQLQSAIMTSRQ